MSQEQQPESERIIFSLLSDGKMPEWWNKQWNKQYNACEKNSSLLSFLTEEIKYRGYMYCKGAMLGTVLSTIFVNFLAKKVVAAPTIFGSFLLFLSSLIAYKTYTVPTIYYDTGKMRESLVKGRVNVDEKKVKKLFIRALSNIRRYKETIELLLYSNIEITEKFLQDFKKEDPSSAIWETIHNLGSVVEKLKEIGIEAYIGDTTCAKKLDGLDGNKQPQKKGKSKGDTTINTAALQGADRTGKEEKAEQKPKHTLFFQKESQQKTAKKNRQLEEDKSPLCKATERQSSRRNPNASARKC